MDEPTKFYDGVAGLIAIFGSGAFLATGIIILIYLIARERSESEVDNENNNGR